MCWRLQHLTWRRPDNPERGWSEVPCRYDEGARTAAVTFGVREETRLPYSFFFQDQREGNSPTLIKTNGLATKRAEHVGCRLPRSLKQTTLDANSYPCH